MEFKFDIEKPRIGWIGTGVMGASMCGHLLKAGYPMTVFNRTPEKCEGLVAAGASPADSLRAVAEKSDIVFAIVGYPQDVREVFLSDHGVANHCQPGSILIDMTTSDPSLAIEIEDVANEKGLHALDAPVSGGDIGAQNAALSIMVGGDEDVFAAVSPLFSKMGKTIVYQGPAGSGQHTKMVNQTLIATNMIGVCEALIYAHRSGLDLETVMRSVSSGAAGSWSLSNLGPRIIDNNFDPGFFVEHFVKDMQIALDSARRLNLSLPGLALAHQLYVALKAQGHARKGTHALQFVLSELSGIDWEKR